MALSDNLISYWSLDEASGDALDAHGSNDLTETGGTIAAATGKVNGGRDLEAGDTEHFAKSDNADLSTGDIDFTFAGWCNIESGGLTTRCLIGKWTVGEREYLLCYDEGGGISAGNRFKFAISADGTANVNVSDTTTVSTGTWYFVVAWHDAAANTINIQVNNNTPSSTSHSSGVRNGTSAFVLGALVADFWNFDGILDEWGFWKRVLTSDERTELYNSGNGRDYAYIAGGAPTTAKRLINGGLVNHSFMGGGLVAA